VCAGVCADVYVADVSRVCVCVCVIRFGDCLDGNCVCVCVRVCVSVCRDFCQSETGEVVCPLLAYEVSVRISQRSALQSLFTENMVVK